MSQDQLNEVFEDEQTGNVENFEVLEDFEDEEESEIEGDNG